MQANTLVQDLLTENRYWTFWSCDWKIRVNVFWAGKTKWADVKKAVGKKYFNLGKRNEIEHGCERQVSLQKPDISFK